MGPKSPALLGLKLFLSVKYVKLLNKMTYFYELKLLQKRKLSQLQRCCLFSINRNMTWVKQNLKLLQVPIPIIFDTTCTLHCISELFKLEEAVRKLRSLFHSRCDTQLKREKVGLSFIEFNMFPINMFKILHKKTCIHSISFDFVNKRQPLFQH